MPVVGRLLIVVDPCAVVAAACFANRSTVLVVGAAAVEPPELLMGCRSLWMQR